jgi:hypothetical protein
VLYFVQEGKKKELDEITVQQCTVQGKPSSAAARTCASVMNGVLNVALSAAYTMSHRPSVVTIMPAGIGDLRWRRCGTRVAGQTALPSVAMPQLASAVVQCIGIAQSTKHRSAGTMLVQQNEGGGGHDVY